MIEVCPTCAEAYGPVAYEHEPPTGRRGLVALKRQGNGMNQLTQEEIEAKRQELTDQFNARENKRSADLVEAMMAATKKFLRRTMASDVPFDLRGFRAALRGAVAATYITAHFDDVTQSERVAELFEERNAAFGEAMQAQLLDGDANREHIGILTDLMAEMSRARAHVRAESEADQKATREAFRLIMAGMAPPEAPSWVKDIVGES